MVIMPSSKSRAGLQFQLTGHQKQRRINDYKFDMGK
jgi:hypothetical protein